MLAGNSQVSILTPQPAFVCLLHGSYLELGKRYKPSVVRALVDSRADRSTGGQWQDAKHKAKSALRLDVHILQTRCDPNSGRCWHDPSKNWGLARLLGRMFPICGHQQHAKYRNPQKEQGKLDFLNRSVGNEYKTKAGINQPHLYKPGKEEREDPKLVNPAVFLIKATTDTGKSTLAPVNLPNSRQGLQSGPDPSVRNSFPQALLKKAEYLQTKCRPKEVSQGEPLVEDTDANRIDQVMLKIDKWASAWLAGEIGNSDFARESFEICLHMPDVLEGGEVVERAAALDS